MHCLKIFSLALLAFLVSCALTDIKIKHRYVAKSRKTTSEGKIYIFVNHKPSKKVGVKKGGYGNETASVYLGEAQSEWLKKAIISEFQAYGYEILPKPQSGIPSIHISINQLFVEPDIGFWSASIVGICDLSVKLKNSTNNKYKRNFVEIDESAEMVWTDNDFLNRFTGAVNNALTDIVIQTHTLLANKE